jgi:ABC-2 type transport system permease protein
MNGALFRKLLRDLRVPLLVVAVLLCAFQCLWAKITDRISNDLMPQLQWLGGGRNVSPEEIENTIFGGPGKIVKVFMGGENISLFRVTDMLSVGYMEPLVIVILCVWAIGRAAGAIVGEVDRGTMELLLAQPVARYRVVLAHLCVDLLTIPVVCLSLWLGNWLGLTLVEVKELTGPGEGSPINPGIFGPAQWSVGGLLFAVSGSTMWLSALGRFRGRVLGIAVLVTLLQFLVHIVGQLWDAVACLRPFTVFYYYQPQELILHHRGTMDLAQVWPLGHPLMVNGFAVLAAVGAVGYLLALWTFCRRDLPAPL